MKYFQPKMACVLKLLPLVLVWCLVGRMKTVMVTRNAAAMVVGHGVHLQVRRYILNTYGQTCTCNCVYLLKHLYIYL